MKQFAILLTAVLALAGFKAYSALQPTAEIEVVGFSPQEIHDLHMTGEPSTGLSVVGKGELVYLKATPDGATYAWTITSQPSGSTVTVDSTATQITTFRPDVVGKYDVEVTVTTNEGSASATHTITAAEYVGVGVYASEGVEHEVGECNRCHSRQAANWLETGHADMFIRGINGVASSHYNENCISCHVVGYNTNPAADNMGFDDVAEQLGWEFPEHPQEGEWANLVQNYPELANRANIQCENCHGPGSEHLGDITGTEVSLEEEVCGRCHEEAPYHRIATQWKNSTHAQGTSFAYAGTRGSCASCHSGHGFIDAVDPETNLRITTSDTPVTCAVCHDPHENNYQNQLRIVENVTLPNGYEVTFGEEGRLCMQCHQGRRDAESYAVPENASSHFGPHHSNQTDMLAGTNAVTWGYVLPNSTHYAVIEDACVGCHMAQTPDPEQVGRDVVGEHSFAMSAEMPDGTHVEAVGACVDCHGNIESFSDIKARRDFDGDGAIEGAKAEIEGLMHEVAMLLPPLGQPEVVTSKDFTVLQMQAAFNYFFVEDDHSHGMHNFQYAANLLLLTLDALESGVMAANRITEIADVPNDQGKQVMVKWQRFGGDGVGNAPLQMYYVWRKVDDAAPAGKNAKIYDGFEAAANADADGGQVIASFEDGLWTKVANQPAVAQDLYAAVAPTLYDSTASDGAQWSTFMVSGHAANTQVYVVSEPMQAYSIDNLAPSAPAGVIASKSGNQVTLTWQEAMDADLNYVAVYRGTSSDFTPGEPIATVTGTEFTDLEVQTGQQYFYKLAAFDFAGNRSAFSSQVAVTVDIESLAGVPSEFQLDQNYPNPFNPSTQITFGVKETGNVRISVFDVSGKEVAVLMNRTMTPGRYNVTWSGENMASGVYFYKMEAGAFVSVKTMLLLK